MPLSVITLGKFDGPSVASSCSAESAAVKTYWTQDLNRACARGSLAPVDLLTVAAPSGCNMKENWEGKIKAVPAAGPAWSVFGAFARMAQRKKAIRSE